MLETIDLVQCSKADDFDAHLVCPQDGELDLAVDALLRRRDEVLQCDSDNKERRIMQSVSRSSTQQEVYRIDRIQSVRTGGGDLEAISGDAPRLVEPASEEVEADGEGLGEEPLEEHEAEGDGPEREQHRVRGPRQRAAGPERERHVHRRHHVHDVRQEHEVRHPVVHAYSQATSHQFFASSL